MNICLQGTCILTLIQYGMTAMCLFKKIVISIFLYSNIKLLHLHHSRKKKIKKKKSARPKPRSPKYCEISQPPLVKDPSNEIKLSRDWPH